MHHSYATTSGFHPNKVNLASNQMALSNSESALSSLEVGNRTLLHNVRLASYNRAHPAPTFFDMRHYQSSRLEKQNRLLKLESDIALTQETTRSAYEDMLTHYDGVSIDYEKLKPVDASTLPSECVRRSWTGLAIFFNPTLFEMDPEYDFNFIPFDSKDQKGWSDVKSALSKLIVKIFSPCSSCISSSSDSNVGTLRSVFKELFSSLSGPLRTDGILVLPLIHKESRKPMVICTTHLESFNPTIRGRQIESLSSRITALKERHPEAIFIVGGDLNFDQRNPITIQGSSYHSASDFFEKELGALPFDAKSQPPTMKKQVIDALYVIPPKACEQYDYLDSILVLPPDDYEADGLLSDHKMILRRVTFN